MRVAYFSEYFHVVERYGLSKYADELHRYLQDENDIDVIPCTISGRLTQKMQPFSGRRFTPFGRRTTLRLWRKFGLPPAEWWVRNIDVVHTLEPSYAVSTRKPWVVTIHDIIPITHPQFSRVGYQERMSPVIREAAARAAMFLCISQATADELQEYLKVDLRDRIRVIPQGAPEVYLEEAGEDEAHDVNTLLGGKEPFFLFTGAVSPRKNLTRIIQALELIADQIPHHFVLTGRLGWEYEATLEAFANSPYRRRIHRLGFVSEEHVRALCRRADAFLYPSLVEGFGLPILEAMASGCPVLTSNISSMPEVAGDAALLVEPYDVEAIAQGMLKLVQDQAYANELRVKGKARAKQLSWRLCASRTAQLYREVGT